MEIGVQYLILFIRTFFSSSSVCYRCYCCFSVLFSFSRFSQFSFRLTLLLLLLLLFSHWFLFFFISIYYYAWSLPLVCLFIVVVVDQFVIRFHSTVRSFVHWSVHLSVCVYMFFYWYLPHNLVHREKKYAKKASTRTVWIPERCRTDRVGKRVKPQKNDDNREEMAWTVKIYEQQQQKNHCHHHQ